MSDSKQEQVSELEQAKSAKIEREKALQNDQLVADQLAALTVEKKTEDQAKIAETREELKQVAIDSPASQARLEAKVQQDELKKKAVLSEQSKSINQLKRVD